MAKATEVKAEDFSAVSEGPATAVSASSSAKGFNFSLDNPIVQGVGDLGHAVGYALKEQDYVTAFGCVKSAIASFQNKVSATQLVDTFNHVLDSASKYMAASSGPGGDASESATPAPAPVDGSSTSNLPPHLRGAKVQEANPSPTGESSGASEGSTGGNGGEGSSGGK